MRPPSELPPLELPELAPEPDPEPPELAPEPPELPAPEEPCPELDAELPVPDPVPCPPLAPELSPEPDPELTPELEPESKPSSLGEGPLEPHDHAAVATVATSSTPDRALMTSTARASCSWLPESAPRNGSSHASVVLMLEKDRHPERKIPVTTEPSPPRTKTQRLCMLGVWRARWRWSAIDQPLVLRRIAVAARSDP